MITRPEKFEETILFLAKKLKGNQYALRGTASLFLQGVTMNIEDIDLLCNQKTALRCNKIFKDFLAEKVSYKESPKFKSYFGKFKINGILVEVMGEWQIKNSKGAWSQSFVAGLNEIREIQWRGEKLPVTTVEIELAMFAQMGRWNAYHKIKKQLNLCQNNSQLQLI